MRYRTYCVTYSNVEKFQLRCVEQPIIGNVLENVANWLCQLTHNRSCGYLCTPAMVWTEKHTITLETISITREQAEKLSRDDSWSWLDTED